MDATYDLHAQVLKVLADRGRLEIVHLLGTGPRDASSLASGIGSDERTVYRHLSVLIAAGLVETLQSNGTVRYGLSDAEVMASCELMRGVIRPLVGMEERAQCGAAASRTDRPHNEESEMTLMRPRVVPELTTLREAIDRLFDEPFGFPREWPGIDRIERAAIDAYVCARAGPDR